MMESRLYSARTNHIWCDLLSKAWFEALVTDEDAFEILGGGCLDALSKMPSGSMVSPSTERVEQGAVWRGDENRSRQETMAKILAFSKEKRTS